MRDNPKQKPTPEEQELLDRNALASLMEVVSRGRNGMPYKEALKVFEQDLSKASHGFRVQFSRSLEPSISRLRDE